MSCTYKFKIFANEKFKRCPSTYDFCRASMLENLLIRTFICYLFTLDLLYGDYIRQSPIHNRASLLDCGLYFKCQVNDIVPGLSTLVKLSVPDQRSNKVEVQYMNNYFGVATGISLEKSPLLSLSGVTGIGFFSIGTEISFDTATKTLAECSGGLSFDTDILSASLTL
uniref:Voltage-dependent anion channel n=1 Tax=Solanum tuberosum TaxID=4113 RepID=M1CDK4_SOLTU